MQLYRSMKKDLDPGVMNLLEPVLNTVGDALQIKTNLNRINPLNYIDAKPIVSAAQPIPNSSQSQNSKTEKNTKK